MRTALLKREVPIELQTPLDIPSLLCWLTIERMVGPLSGGGYGARDMKTGKYTTTAGAGPLRGEDTSRIGGRLTLDFSASKRLDLVVSVPSGASTIAMILRRGGNGSYSCGNADASMDWHQEFSQMRGVRKDRTLDIIVVSTAMAQPCVVVGSHNGSNPSLGWMNGTSAVSSDSSNTATSATAIVVGTSAKGTISNTHIGELVLFSAAFSTITPLLPLVRRWARMYNLSRSAIWS